MTTRATPVRPRRRRRAGPGRVVAYAVLIVASVAALFPVIWTVMTSVKTREDTFAIPPKFFGFEATTGNYTRLVDATAFTSALWNTLVITVGATTLAVLLASLCAYSLARNPRFPGRRPLEASLIIVRAMPGVVLAVPLFQIATTLGFYDSKPALVLAYAAVSLPFAIWLMTSYMDQVPAELEECARTDGASSFSVLVRVVAPLAAPGAAATAIFVALLCWNEFLLPLVLASDNGRTVPIVISGFISARTLDWGPMAAAATVAILPIALLTVLLQRQLVSGLSAGAVKE